MIRRIRSKTGNFLFKLAKWVSPNKPKKYGPLSKPKGKVVVSRHYKVTSKKRSKQ